VQPDIDPATIALLHGSGTAPANGPRGPLFFVPAAWERLFTTKCRRRRLLFLGSKPAIARDSASARR
jgi:hypothetical protein